MRLPNLSAPLLHFLHGGPRALGRRAHGAILVGLGALALVAPFVVGEWTIALVGLLVLAAGLAELLHAILSSEAGSSWATYLSGVLMSLVGLALFLRPMLLLGGLLMLVALLLFGDGIAKAVSAFRGDRGAARRWTIFNGLVNVALALLVWNQRASVGALALGLVVGLYILANGWAALLAPAGSVEESSVAAATDEHPDAALGLSPNPCFGRFRAAAIEREDARGPADRLWLLTLVAVFFAIHVGRTNTEWTWLGLVSPAVAVAGDVFMALLLAAVIILPARLSWRKLTRSIERGAWERRLTMEDRTDRLAFGERLTHAWLDGRLRWAVHLRRARGSFQAAVWAGLRAGLPLTAILVATNPVWGFSWYFNTENWASGVWQKVAETRVDRWREAMIRAVGREYQATGASADSLFEVRPEGVKGTTDFAFLVIGDPGEGDSSQQALRDRYVDLGRRPDVKFLVVASDVIYPDGAMKDYEFNFYLPFKGFEKPIYAIPGNHDWFNALDGFLANFLEPSAARASMRARVALDLPGIPPNETRISRLIAEASRLRGEYGVRTGEQRGPFFEIHGDAFSLVAADTGILRRLDPAEAAWLEQAMGRARGRFAMVILGHPLYAGGLYQGARDEPFAAIHHLLRSHGARVVMAGDTHDFEYYRERTDTPGGPAAIHHFVNGGGGAYLSIGTALTWPAAPPLADWAFYPRGAAVRAKLDAETPAWKRPVWWWVRRLGAWPASVEALSAVFNFNRAPFFQSFMEVRVEGSARRVRFILHGANGPLRWRDLETGGTARAAGRGEDDLVEFLVPMGGAK